MAQDYLLSLSGRQTYAVAMEARGAQITGICIVKPDAEGWRGAIVNEFGIHALDFTLRADRRKVKLQNVMPMMDRWYIKRTVSKDLALLFSAQQDGQQKGGRTVAVGQDSTIVLTNVKHKLKYSLKKLNETAE